MLDSKKQRRLVRVLEAHRARLRGAREDRNAAIEQFAGSHYAGRDEMDREPIAMVELAVVVFTHLLASNRPRYMLGTEDSALLAQAISYELALNKTAKRMRIEKAFQALTQAGMFGLATLWLGLTESDVNFYNMVGMPALANIDFDDLVYDTEAKCWEECQFIAHRYQLPYDAVMESDLFDPEARAKLKRKEDGPTDSYGEERLQLLGSGESNSAEMLDDTTELWNIWYPRQRLIVTIPADGQDVVLRQVEWTGPRHGPYTRLSFNDVPNNILPSAPINVILDLHELVNKLYVHTARQALRQKNNFVVAHGKEDDAERYTRAKDGEGISLSGTGQQTSSGGADAKTLGMIADAMNKYRYFLGNLDSIAGLSTMADTASAEGQLLQQANSRLNYMRMRVNDVARSAGEDILHYIVSDPFFEQRVSRQIPGLDVSATYAINNSQGPVDLSELDLDVDQYSMQPRNPQQKLQAMMSIITGIAQPFGMLPTNPAALVKRASQLADVEAEVANQFQAGPPQTMPQQPQVNPNKPNGKYEVTRRSTSTATGKDAAMAQMMSGMGNGQRMQPAEMAMATQ